MEFKKTYALQRTNQEFITVSLKLRHELKDFHGNQTAIRQHNRIKEATSGSRMNWINLQKYIRENGYNWLVSKNCNSEIAAQRPLTSLSETIYLLLTVQVPFVATDANKRSLYEVVIIDIAPFKIPISMD